MELAADWGQCQRPLHELGIPALEQKLGKIHEELPHFSSSFLGHPFSSPFSSFLCFLPGQGRNETQELGGKEYLERDGAGIPLRRFFILRGVEEN